jgi:hypothetical protein
MGLATGYCPPLEVSGFLFNKNVTIFSGGTSNAGLPFLARPVQFLDLPLGPGIPSENVEYINVPTVANGNISITAQMSFWNIDANGFFNFCQTDALKLDMILGYRHTDFSESLNIASTLGGNLGLVRFADVVYPAGYSTTAFDNFRTTNTFDGGQIGLRGVLSYQKWSLFTDLKLAVGVTQSTLTIEGNSTLNEGTTGRVLQTLPGGVLALPTNSGSRSENLVSIIPEVNFTVSYQLNSHFRFFAGYNALFWSQVIRPGDHINSTLDSRQIPTDQNYTAGVAGLSPSFPGLVNRNFFAYGFSVGVEIGF